MFLSVIMPSQLGNYPFCADKREERFIFAVNSFIDQSYKDSELIIISDGCDKTIDIAQRNFIDNPRINIHQIPKQAYFSGEPRNVGMKIAKGDLILYLDNDDFIGRNHLEIIAQNYDQDADFCYFDDYYFQDFRFGVNKFVKRSVSLDPMLIGTCSIVHKKNEVLWKDGYGHDRVFIKDMIENGAKYKKIATPEYFVCHLPNKKESFNLEKPNILLIN